MADAQEILTVERVLEWTAESELELSRACVHAEPGELRQQFDAGAVLFMVRNGCGVAVGFYLLRVDGDEGVIVAAAGNGRGVDLVGHLLPFMERQFVGVRKIRIHTSRPGLIRRLVAQGYEPREMVMAKDVK